MGNRASKVTESYVCGLINTNCCNCAALRSEKPKQNKKKKTKKMKRFFESFRSRVGRRAARGDGAEAADNYAKECQTPFSPLPAANIPISKFYLTDSVASPHSQLPLTAIPSATSRKSVRFEDTLAYYSYPQFKPYENTYCSKNAHENPSCVPKQNCMRWAQPAASNYDELCENNALAEDQIYAEVDELLCKNDTNEELADVDENKNAMSSFTKERLSKVDKEFARDSAYLEGFNSFSSESECDVSVSGNSISASESQLSLNKVLDGFERELEDMELDSESEPYMPVTTKALTPTPQQWNNNIASEYYNSPLSAVQMTDVDAMMQMLRDEVKAYDKTPNLSISTSTHLSPARPFSDMHPRQADIVSMPTTIQQTHKSAFSEVPKPTPKRRTRRVHRPQMELETTTWNFWVPCNQLEPFTSCQDRRIRSIAIVSCTEFELTQERRRNASGTWQQKVVATATSGWHLKKCQNLVYDKFSRFWWQDGVCF